METINTKSVGEVSSITVDTLSGPSLAALYNELTDGKTVKKFRDRTTGLSRVKPLVLAELERRNGKNKKNGARRRKLFDMEPADEIKSFRTEGTKRARLIAMLTDGRGRTREEIKKEFGWDDHLTYEHVWTVGKYVGFGVKEDPETGVIKFFRKGEMP